MIIYILHNSCYYTLKLPNDISGSYMLKDCDLYGTSRVLTNVYSENGKWFLNSNNNLKIIQSNQAIDRVELNLYSFYNLNYNGIESILLYISDGYDNTFVSKMVSDNALLKIGRKNDCDIIVSSNYFNDIQLELSYNQGVWKYNNLVPETPIYVNAKRVDSGNLFGADYLFAMGLKIVVCGNIIFIGGYPGLISMMSSNLSEANLSYAVSNMNTGSTVYLDFFDEKDYFFKSPVFRKKFKRLDIAITDPEPKKKSDGESIIMSMIPSLLMSLTTIVSTYYTIANYKKGGGTQETLVTSLLMCAVLLFTSIIWPFVEKFANFVRNLINERKRIATYKKYLKSKRKVFINAVNEQKMTLEFNNLSLQECQDAIMKRTSNLFSRNIDQENFLTVKVGTGKVLLDCIVDYKKPDFLTEKDKLLDAIDAMIEEFKYIDNAPFSLSLKDNVAFINSEGNFDLYIQYLVLQIVALHDYESLKIVVFTTPNSVLNKIKNLGHCWDNERENRYFATNSHEAESLSSLLLRVFNDRASQDSNNNDNGKSLSPHYLIISDDPVHYKDIKIIEKVLYENHNTSFSSIFFASKISDVPDGCHRFVNYTFNDATYFESEMEENDISKFTPEFMDSTINFDYCMQQVSNIPLKITSESSGVLPTKLGFLEMYKVGNVSQLNSINRWNNPSVINSLAAPLGVDARGDLVNLDLHEKAHGPHGLIAGMTGSGKSETIVTYILSMAVSYSPNEVQFVLIDYKGGGLAGAFENRKTGVKLPHLVGTITNLDKSSMNRTLVSIKSELQRRQRVFNEAKEQLNTGTIDIYKYQKLVRDGALKDPLAHLFIICDEFAELKQQQPDFMDELVSAARIGRSLGVHLILATQKPSGVVDEQIWSNSKFKICCKVQTAEDSNEMIRKPDAAYIKESGRFYLQVGYDEIYVKGQSAYTGTKYVPSDIINVNADNAIDFVEELGNVYRTVKKEKKAEVQSADLGEELGNVLNYLIECAKQIGYQNQQLWLDNVPTNLLFENLQKKYPIAIKRNVMAPLIGEYDDPANQKQGFVAPDFTHDGNMVICGLTGSGKTTLLSTIIYSIITTHNSDEVNIFIMDFGIGTLKMFQSAPQVAQFLTASNRNEVEKLLYYLKYEINRRKTYFANKGGSFSSCVDSGDVPFPNILILINAFEVFKEAFEDMYEEVFPSLTRECSRVGIIFVITSGTSSPLPYTISDNFPQRISLHFSDPSNYSDVFASSTALIPGDNPGRGLIKLDQIYEFQTSIIFDSMYIERNLNYVLSQLEKFLKKAPGIPKMPRIVTTDYIKKDINSLSDVPIGLDVRSNCSLCYNFEPLITPVLYNSVNGALSFEHALIETLSLIKNIKVIALNVFGKIDEVDGAQIYDNNYKNLCIALYNNILKKKDDISDEKIVFVIGGYVQLQSHLTKLVDKDTNVKTIDDLIDASKESNKFKFIIFENKDFDNVDNTSWADYFEYSKGILLGMEADDQELLDVDSDYNHARITRDVGIAVIESQGNYIKYIRTKK